MKKGLQNQREFVLCVASVAVLLVASEWNDLVVFVFLCLLAVGVYLLWREKAPDEVRVSRTSDGVPVVSSIEALSHMVISQLHDQYGDTFYLEGKRGRVLYVRHPSDVKKILLKAQEWIKPEWEIVESMDQTHALQDGGIEDVSNLMQPMYEKTVFHMDGAPWRFRRRLLASQFAAQKIHLLAFADAITCGFSASGESPQKPTHWLHGTPVEDNLLDVDIQHSVHIILQEFIYQLLVGNKIDISEDFRGMCVRMSDHFAKKFALRESDISSDCQQHLFEVTQYAKKNVLPALREQMAAADQEEDTTHRTWKGVLEMMLQAGDEVEEDEICKTFTNFVIAGAESNAVSLAYTIFLVAMHSTVQSRIKEEIEECGLRWSSSVQDIVDSLSRMPYLDSTVKEGLRLYAPATIVHRQSVGDSILPLRSGMGEGEHLVPAGTKVGICIHSVHNNPEYWKATKEFSPERHQSKSFSPTYPYMPFSLGPRGCPGAQMAYAHAKIIIIQLLLRYKLVPPTEDQVKRALRLGAYSRDTLHKFVEWNPYGIHVRLQTQE